MKILDHHSFRLSIVVLPEQLFALVILIDGRFRSPALHQRLHGQQVSFLTRRLQSERLSSSLHGFFVIA